VNVQAHFHQFTVDSSIISPRYSRIHLKCAKCTAILIKNTRRLVARHFANDNIQPRRTTLHHKLGCTSGMRTLQTRSTRSCYAVLGSQHAPTCPAGTLSLVEGWITSFRLTIYGTRRAGNNSSYELSVHSGYLSCCRFINDPQIVTALGDMACMLWDIKAGIRVMEFNDHTGDVMRSMCVSFSAKLSTNGLAQLIARAQSKCVCVGCMQCDCDVVGHPKRKSHPDIYWTRV
jgi:hypothetical protein